MRPETRAGRCFQLVLDWVSPLNSVFVRVKAKGDLLSAFGKFGNLLAFAIYFKKRDVMDMYAKQGFSIKICRPRAMRVG